MTIDDSLRDKEIITTQGSNDAEKGLRSSLRGSLLDRKAHTATLAPWSDEQGWMERSYIVKTALISVKTALLALKRR